MKKVYLLITLIFVVYLSDAQQSFKTPNTQNKKINDPQLEVDKKKISDVKKKLQRNGGPVGQNHTNYAVWWDDFDISLPSKWTLTHAPGTAYDWIISTQGPSGQFPIDTILSPTNQNGFATFDSDFFCDTASASQVADMTMANSVDLTGHTNVRLRFYQYYRKFQDRTYVYVSNNGTSWTPFQVNSTQGLFDYSSFSGAVNPELTYIDISSVAANQPTVWVRFEYFSPDSLGPNAACGFAWEIDDVSIEDIPAIDPTLDFALCGEFSRVPILQSEGIQLRGKVVNNGSATLSGAKILFGVFDFNFTLLFLDSSAVCGNVLPGDTSGWLTGLNSYVPTSDGFYFVDQIVSLAADSDSTNNFVRGFFEVNDSIYRRDYAYWSTESYKGTLGYTQPISFGEMYHVYQPSAFTSASVYLSSPSVGDTLSISVYNTAGGLPTTQIGTTGNYYVTAVDTGNFGSALLTLPFTTAVSVTTGDYFVCVNQVGVHNLTLGYCDLIFTPARNYLKYGAFNWTSFEVAGVPGITPLLWVANPSSTVGIKEAPAKNSAFVVFPNPATDIVNFVSMKGNSSDITIQVSNSLGAIVKTEKYEMISHGSIDLSKFPGGVYTLTITSDSQKEIKSIVLQ